MKKRMLALLLTLCMVFSLLPAQAVVAEGTATDLTLDANQIGTFTPTTSGTYVFYDTTSQNENGNEWGISIQYAAGDNTYADVGVAVNDTYNTRGYRAELTANTTYTVVANNNSNRTLSLKVAPAAYGGDISFSKLAEEAKGAIVGGQWGLDVVPVAPNGVLGQVDWSAVVSATDDTTTDCVNVTEKDECATLDFIKEGTFLLKATCGEKGCSMEITVQDAPAEPPQGGGSTGSLTVSLDGYHGDESYGGGMMTLPGDGGNPWNTRYTVWEWASAGQTVADLTGISSMPDPKWEGFTFEGWLLYREDGDPFNSPRVLTLESRNPISTADMLASTIPGYSIGYIAKWKEIGWEYYENVYDPYFGVSGGENGGDGVPNQNIHVSANGGTMSYTGFDGQRYEDCDAYSGLLEEGKSLADMGFEMTDDDVKYWTDRALEGWRQEIQTPIYNENGEWIDSNWDSLDGLLTTEEVVNYTIPDGRIYYFYAQWAGNDSDYVAWVEFSGRGAMIALENVEGGQWTQEAYGMRLKKNGTTIGSQADVTVVGAVEGDPAWGTFQGWLACERLGEVTAMKSTTVYTFDQIKAMAVEEDLLLIPKWSGVALEDYAEQFNVLMPVDHIAMTVGVKYDVAAESTAYFKFTAPADGAYMLRTDAHQGIDSEMALNMDGWPQSFFDPMGVTLEMTKGETIQFMATATQAAKVWVEDVNEVVKMELVSQDKTATYILDEFFNPEGTLKDVVLKVTFEDGTVIEGNGEEVFQKAFWGNNGVFVEGFVEEDGDKVTVGWESGSAKVSYPIALDKATITGFEVIPAADMFDIYEGTMCYEEDGEFVYEEAVAASAQLASYKFTWSDGTVEVYQPDPEADLYYHGTLIFYHTVYPSGWTAGTHNVPIAFGELTDDLPVIIKENNIKSIKLLSLGVDQYTLGDPDFFEKSGNGWVMNSYDISEYELQVNYVDGTSKILTEEDETDFRGLFALLDNTIVGGDIEQKVHTAPGKNKVYMILADQIAEYEVSIVEQAVVNGNASVSEETVKEALEAAKGSTVTLDATTGSTTDQTSSVKLPTASVEDLAEAKKDVVVKLNSATVTLDAKALEAITEQAGDAVTITLVLDETDHEDLTEKQQAALKNENVEVVLTALVLADGEPIGDFRGGSVKVHIAFTPESGYKYQVKYVADDGKITNMTTEVGAGYLAFWTNHFSDYVVTKEKEETPTSPGGGAPGEVEPSKPTEPAETTKPTEATKPSNPAVPNTGDNSGVTGMMLLMLASGTMAAALWLSLRKRRAA